MDLWELDTRVAPQPKGKLAQLSETAPRFERAVYTSLAAISVGAASAAADLGNSADAVVFCGANARDLNNAARCGLRAAGDLGIVCPLADLSPDIVTQLAQVISSAKRWGSFRNVKSFMDSSNNPFEVIDGSFRSVLKLHVY